MNTPGLEGTSMHWTRKLGGLTLCLAALTLFGAASADARAPRCHGHKATIVGTSHRDVLHGTSHRDVIVAGGGGDRVSGGGGNDIICGGSGRDRLSGGSGRDRLY